MALGLAGRALPGIQLDGSVPIAVDLETDLPVDDIAVLLEPRGLLQIQAKQSLGMGDTFARVVAQWRKAGNHGIDPVADRLLLVVERPSSTITKLGEVLDRKRSPRPGKPSPSEVVALEGLGRLISDLSPAERDVLLLSAFVLPLDLSKPSSAHRLAAQTLLDGRVVPDGQGRRAFEALVRIAWRKARLRQGGTMEDWVAELGNENFQLLTGEAGTHLTVARSEATKRYLQVVIGLGSHLDLRGLGIPISNLPFASPGHWLRVTTEQRNGPRSDRHADEDLNWALRRRGRCLLTGLPGAGKSVALRQLAARWAAENDAPLPFLVSLKRLAAITQAGVDPRAALVEVVAERFPEEDRMPIGQTFKTALRTGRAALLFDGLDETRERRHQVIVQIEEVLRDVHPDVEVLLSTRDSAYAEARTLGFAELRLHPPADLPHTLWELCRLLAQNAAVSDIEAWVRRRMRWVENLQKEVPELSETPLLPVLLVVLSATRHPDALPRSRAHILSAIVDDAVERLEVTQKRQGEWRLGGLAGSQAREAARRSFNLIGHEIRSGDTELSQVESALSTMCTKEFGLAPGQAAATSTDLRHFWDEAGVFPLDGFTQKVAARLQLLGEVADARWAASLLESDQRSWTRSQVATAKDGEAVLLAAGLSRVITDELIEAACVHGDERLDVLAASACLAGARPSPREFTKLVTSLRRRFPYVSTNSRVDIAQILARLPITSEAEQRQIEREVLAALPAPQHLLFKAMAIIGWNLSGPEAERVLTDLMRSDKPRGEGIRANALMPAHTGFGWAIIQAARRLVPAHPELAQLIAETADRTSKVVSDRLVEILREAGYTEEAQRPNLEAEQQMAPLLKSFELSHLAEKRLFEWLAARGRTNISFGQRRRLDQLADLVATMLIPQSAFLAVAKAFARDAGGFEYLLDLVPRLAGLDVNVIGSQASVLLEENTQGDIGSLYIGARSRALARWSEIKDPTATMKRLVELVTSGSELVSDVARDALQNCPQLTAAIELIVASLEGLTTSIRYRAATAVEILGESKEGLARARSWARSEDTVLRAVAAAVFGHTVARGILPPFEAELSLSDPDLWVRRETESRLERKNVPGGVVELIKRSHEQPAVRWTCRECGEINKVEAENCANCNETTPRRRGLIELD